MKKFTCTDKWDNNWHFALSPFHKLAWSFVNDRCDHAGVIEVPDVLMAGYVGDPSFTMEAFAIIAGPERIVRLASGAWWLPKYVGFQHAGGVSAKKKPHQPAVRSIIKNRLPILIGNDSDGVYAVHNQWVKDSSLSPIPYPTDKDVLRKTYVNDSYRDRDKEKDQEKETDQGLRADGFLDFALELPPCCALNIEPTTDEIDAARRHDPVAPLIKQTGLTRDQMTAYIATLNSGAEKFTPESLLLAYANELTQREYRVYRGGIGQRTAPLVSLNSFRTDCERFVDLARTKPEKNKLVLRSAANAKPKADTLRPPCQWWREICEHLYDGSDMHTAENWMEIPLSAREGIWSEFIKPVHTKAVASRHAH